jgi:hypothetical protein
MGMKREKKVSAMRSDRMALTPAREEWLVMGWNMLDSLEFEDLFEDMDHCREVWQKHKDNIMRSQFQHDWFGGPEERRPGWRPWGWWQFEAPDPPEDLRDGLNSREPDKETLDYLKRLNLFEPWEKTELGITD